MIRTIAIILLALSTAGAGYFGWTQKKSSAAATAQVGRVDRKKLKRLTKKLRPQKKS
jgi:carbonic anhydrase